MDVGVAAAPGPRLRVLGTRAAFVVDGVDGQEDALRSGGARTTPERWGVEPESRWGRLVQRRGERGGAERAGRLAGLLRGLERALREGGPPPVDPRDAVAALEVLEAARRSAAEGRIDSSR